MATLEEMVDKAIQVAVKRALLDAHPVGSIYLTIKDENPSAKFGGTWEKLPSSVCLQTADTTHGAGTTIAAGLPSLPEIDILYRRDCTATGVEVNKYGNDGMSNGIIEGAKWIADNYYDNGQTSLYTMSKKVICQFPLQKTIRYSMTSMKR